LNPMSQRICAMRGIETEPIMHDALMKAPIGEVGSPDVTVNQIARRADMYGSLPRPCFGVKARRERHDVALHHALRFAAILTTRN
jgi:hypothetical protein